MNSSQLGGVYAKAVRQLLAAREEVARLESFIATYESFLFVEVNRVEAVIVDDPPPRRRCAVSERDIVNATRAILMDGRPRTLAQIHKALTAGGFVIDGARPAKRLTVAISRRGLGRIVRTPYGYIADGVSA